MELPPRLLLLNNLGRRRLWRVESSGYDAAKGFASQNTQPSILGDLEHAD